MVLQKYFTQHTLYNNLQNKSNKSSQFIKQFANNCIYKIII